MSSQILRGAIDNHIHCCPHINKRSTNIFEVVRYAEKHKMYAIGLMDNFSNTSEIPNMVFICSPMVISWRTPPVPPLTIIAKLPITISGATSPKDCILT